MVDFPSSNKALDQLTTLAHALARANVTGGFDIVVQSSDVIQGQDAAAGTLLVLRGGNSTSGNNPGAIVRVEGGQGFGTGDGGNVLIRPGTAAGTGVVGVITLTNNGGDDDAAVARVESEGANAGFFHMFTGARDPSGAVAAIGAGDLYVRTDNGTLYQASSAGTGGWSQIGASSFDGTVKTYDTRSTPTSTGSIGASGGSVDLDIGSLFDIGELIHLEVERTSGTGGSDVDIEIYTEDTFTNRIYNAPGVDITSVPFIDRTGIFYEDLDASTELHIRITNNSGATFTADVKVVAQGE